MTQPRLWTIVPAAGIGSRMGADRPKPYLRLGSRYLIDVTLERLFEVGAIDRIHLALHAADRWWPDTDSAADSRIVPYTGGTERADSVLAGLDRIRGNAAGDDWVLVHDVARPCVRVSDIEALLAAISADPTGGLLAAPVTDTIKQVATDGKISGTVDRSRLWRALTPQVFRFGVLDRALREAASNGLTVTDESSAVEALGLQPVVVKGHADNIKVTVSEDLALASWHLGKR